jgi:TPR repeat protein
MSNEDEKATGLVPSPSSALSQSGATSLIRRGTQDLIAKTEAEQWLKKGREFVAQQKHEEAFACFQRGIELNLSYSELLCHLADAYHMGHGVPEDEVQAVALYRQAAEQGNVEGQVSLGFEYACGSGVPLDHVEAAKWWRIAAEQGDAEAQFCLASLYEDGLGVPKDCEQAVQWYRKAAEQGNGLQSCIAQSKLGDIYWAGEIVPQDYAQAACWYLKVAVLDGWKDVQCRLGHMYENGLGVPRDREQAFRWYRKAAGQGDEVARVALAALSKHDPGQTHGGS